MILLNNLLNVDKQFDIFPNPADEKLFINSPEKQGMNLSIYNIVGGCVINNYILKESNEIDISHLPNGIYLIKITGVDWAIQRKVIIE